MTGRAVLLSVAPEFAEKIADGTKTVELRKRFPNVLPGTWMYLYVTLPVGAVVGRVKISEVDTANPKKIWDAHKSRVGISRSRFAEYFGDRIEGCAVHLSDYEQIVPVTLQELRRSVADFVVPQSYRYVSASEQAVIHQPRNGRASIPNRSKELGIAAAIEVVCVA